MGGDLLVPLSDWLRNEGNASQNVQINAGQWSLDPKTGFTRIIDSDALCPADQVGLENPRDDAEALQVELSRGVCEMTQVDTIIRGSPEDMSKIRDLVSASAITVRGSTARVGMP